ncbi:hypothetical protein RUM43_011562 [Polyplax serrata]|uniref:C2H2-type domain-containing protein n=1 Tax=Polyplax serrata TaxID=468196 RepID=A0AAN8S7X6_POLSC
MVIMSGKTDDSGLPSNVSHENTENSRTYESYVLLPDEFFPYKDIPVPLVSKSWLQSLRQQLLNGAFELSAGTNSDDEYIPLATLKYILKTNEKKSDQEVKQYSNLSVSSCKKDSQKCETISLVQRKRGRPKKHVVEANQKEAITEHLTENFIDNEENLGSDSVDSSRFECQTNVNNLTASKKYTTTKENNYQQHESSRHIENEITYEIVAKFTDGKTAKENGQMKSSFSCLECGKIFSAVSTLKNHRRIHEGTLLQCPECKRGFTTKYLLKCHMRLHNGDLFMCHKCNKGFTTAELLKVHIRGHTGDRPYACEICQRSFSSASNLSQHKQIHSSEKKFLCSKCGISFNQKRSLDGHMLTHAEKNHMCKICGKLWARKADLTEHMRVHTGVKPYCCNLCPQKFTQTSSLKRHQIVHKPGEPIKCLTCSKLFRCEDYYKRHVRKHEAKPSVN